MTDIEQPDTRFWYTFVDADERTWWITHHATAWNAMLTPAEDQAVQAYQGPTHRSIQAILRGEASALPPDEVARVHAYVAALDTAIYKGQINTNLVLYRGFGSHRAQLQFHVGDEFRMPGYLSLSADPAWAFRFLRIKRYAPPRYVAEVRVPVGTPAGFMTAQLEVILERGTIVRVIALQTPLQPDGPHRITLEVLA